MTLVFGLEWVTMAIPPTAAASTTIRAPKVTTSSEVQNNTRPSVKSSNFAKCSNCLSFFYDLCVPHAQFLQHDYQLHSLWTAQHISSVERCCTDLTLLLCIILHAVGIYVQPMEASTLPTSLNLESHGQVLLFWCHHSQIPLTCIE
jgi:hypothetical protein